MSYKSEFPNYDGDFYCPKGFVDNSWHNDTMPRAMKRYVKNDIELEISIWQDYVDESRREREGEGRYIFEIEVNDDPIFCHNTDDLEIIKSFVENVNDIDFYSHWKIDVGESIVGR